VRVLIINKNQLDKLKEQHPTQIKIIMNNLREHADEVRVCVCVCVRVYVLVFLCMRMS